MITSKIEYLDIIGYYSHIFFHKDEDINQVLVFIFIYDRFEYKNRSK